MKDCFRMAPKFSRRLRSITAEPPVKFQGHMTTFTVDLATLRLGEIRESELTLL